MNVTERLRKDVVDRILKLPANQYSREYLDGPHPQTGRKYSIAELQTYLEELRSNHKREIEAAALTIPPEVAAAINQATEADRQAVAAQRAAAEQAKQDWVLDGICLTSINGRRLVNNIANRLAVLGWLHEDQGETLSPTWFTKVLKENPALGEPLLWEPADPVERLRQDRKTFTEICFHYHLSQSEANFGIWQKTHSTAGMAQATQDEVDEWERQAEVQEAERHREALLNAANKNDLPTLRTLARQEVANQQSEAEKQRLLDIQAQQERDSHLGFPKMPDTWRGEKLDAAHIKNCDPKTQRILTQRFGSAQLTARLHGRG